jgi:hypothetical protein
LKDKTMAVTWVSTLLVAVAVGGIVGGQIYLRQRLGSAREHRSVEQVVLMFTAAAMLGYGLVAIDCVSRGQASRRYMTLPRMPLRYGADIRAG